MKRWTLRIAAALAGLALLAAAALAFALHRADTRMARVLTLPAHPVALRDDAAAVARGRYLFESRGCADCHGHSGGGRRFIDDAKTGMHVAGPNISPGPGNVVAAYRAEDWERTIRHGVKPGGRPLMVMPADDFNRLTDDDLAALVAYVRHLPPVAGGPATLDLPVPVRALYGAGLIPDAAEKIDHALPPSQPVAEGVSVEHGRYVSMACQGCHGATLSGGRIPGGPPDWPAAANLTPGEGSVLPRYGDVAAFKAMLRSGRRPDGSAVSSVMPIEALSKMNDTDVEAVYLYLHSVAPKAAGGR